MARSYLEHLLVENVAGKATFDTDATIKVYKPHTTDEIVDTIYTTRTGVGTRAQGWAAADGDVTFYLDYPQTVRLGITRSGVETYREDIDVGAPYGDENILTYECRPIPGYDNYDALTEALFTTMTDGDWRYIPRGVFQTSQTPLYPAHLDGWLIRGPGPGGTNRLPPAVIQAMPGHTMPAGLAPPEWWYSDPDGEHEDIGQGWCLKDFGLDGGGFSAGRVDTSVVETTSRWLHGLVLHGSGSKVLDIMVVSANGHGITQEGIGRDGTTVLGESHETKIDSCGARWTGLAGIHTGLGQQDGVISGWSKVQYSGTHNLHIEDVGWLILGNHPSWAAENNVDAEKCWQSMIGWNYVGSVGKFQDGSGQTRYGIWTNGSVTVADNVVNTNAPTPGQLDPVTGFRVHTGTVNYHDNRLVYGTGDTAVTDEGTGTVSVDSKVHDNTKYLA